MLMELYSCLWVKAESFPFLAIETRLLEGLIIQSVLGGHDLGHVSLQFVGMGANAVFDIHLGHVDIDELIEMDQWD